MVATNAHWKFNSPMCPRFTITSKMKLVPALEKLHISHRVTLLSEKVQIPTNRSIAAEVCWSSRIQHCDIWPFSASLVLEGDMGVLQHRHALSCSSLGSLRARTALGLAWHGAVHREVSRLSTSKTSECSFRASSRVSRLHGALGVVVSSRLTFGRLALWFALLSFGGRAASRWGHTRGQVASRRVIQGDHREESSSQLQVGEATSSIHIGCIDLIIGVHVQDSLRWIASCLLVLVVGSLSIKLISIIPFIIVATTVRRWSIIALIVTPFISPFIPIVVVGLFKVLHIGSHIATASTTLSKATSVMKTSLGRVLVVLPKHQVQGFSDLGDLELWRSQGDQLLLLLGEVAAS